MNAVGIEENVGENLHLKDHFKFKDLDHLKVEIRMNSGRMRLGLLNMIKTLQT
jgi:hypothetical protein